jgi:DNA polymerase III subunit beta
MIEADVAVGSEMTVTCTKDELAHALGIVSRAVSARTAVQVLLGVLLRAEEGRLHLAATDMEISLRASLEANVESEGAAAVPGRLLVDIVRLLPAGDVALAYRPEEGVLTIEAGTATYRLNTYSTDDFPRLPDIEAVQMLEVDRVALLDTVSRVARSASRDESRPVLTGILVRFEGDKVVMAATDSYRLSVKETALAVPAPELEAIVPARALGELGRIAQGGETLSLGVHENQVVFTADGVWLTTRRIDGQFPNYRQLLPESFEHELRLPRAELLDVVRRTAVLAQRNAPLRLRFADGELGVTAQTQEVGEARESMPAPYAGEPLEIGFNPEFFREGIESVPDEEIVVKLISPLRPAVLQGESDDFAYLVMPIRLPG